MKVFLAIFFAYICYYLAFSAVIVNKQEQNSFRVLNVQNYAPNYSWFSHDVTKIQTTKLSLLLSFYFHVILEHLKTFIQKNFQFKRVLCFAIQGA